MSRRWLRFLGFRLLGLVLTLFAVLTFTFLLTFTVPTDPGRAVVGPKGTPEQLQHAREKLGLNDSMGTQYVRYMGHVVSGDLGYSYAQRRPVVSIISESLPFTIELAAAAIIFQLLVGVGVGLAGAYWAGGWFDRLSLAGSLLLISLPTFWLGLVFIYFLAYKWAVFPLGGAATLWAIVLPSVTMGLPGAAWTSRVVRSEASEYLHGEGVRGLRAKGLAPRGIVLKHTVRASLAPVLTMLSIDLGYFLGGAVLIESVFNWPGIGLTSYQALRQNDIPLLMGCVIVGSVFILLMNFLADLLRMRVDPRVQI